MGDPRAWQDEYTLLCERCGYVIEGLPTDGACPECGRPIAESLPERRVGTPWQQSPGLRSLARTWWLTLRHPARALEVMRFEPRRWIGPLGHTLLLSAGISWVAVCLEGFPNLVSWLLGPVILGTVALTLAAFLLMLSAVEALGLRFLARMKGGRLTPAIAWTVVAHGAAGWMVTFLIWLLGWKAARLYEILHPVSTDLELRRRVAFVTSNILTPSFVGGFVVGLLFFETFAWLGLRRLKYANRVRPTTRGPVTPSGT